MTRPASRREAQLSALGTAYCAAARSQPRATMLETIREFALEQLTASGEEPRLRRRHAEYVATVAENAASGLESADRPKWMRQLAAALARPRDTKWAKVYAKGGKGPFKEEHE